jgi:hypothetical protein
MKELDEINLIGIYICIARVIRSGGFSSKTNQHFGYYCGV